MLKIKKQRSYKPGYVAAIKAASCHLSNLQVTSQLEQSTPRQWMSNP